jgi:hypothetical protein
MITGRPRTCPACGCSSVLREDDRDACILCPWERELARDRLYGPLDPQLTDASTPGPGLGRSRRADPARREAS